MAGYQVNPGPFKAKDADPEGTLETFVKYCVKMERVFRLTRRINPTTGARVNYDDEEKKDMLRIEGGQDMDDLFEHVGKVVNDDTYEEAVNKIKAALKKQGNRTSAVFKLFNGYPQGKQTFETWHRTVHKAARLIDWTGYNAEMATVDALITQTSNHKLQEKAIQENPTLTELINMGLSQEQAKKKSTKMPGGNSDQVIRRLKQENRKLRKGGKEKKFFCEKCRNPTCKGGDKCYAVGKECSGCGKSGHFAKSKLCPKKKKDETSAKIQDAGGEISEADTSESEAKELSGRILVQTVGKMEEDKKRNNIYTTVKMAGPGGKMKTLKMATDTGVRKTILNRGDWKKIAGECRLVRTKIRFRPWGTEEKLPIRGRVKVTIRARAGAEITTYVYVNDDDKDFSLLGKSDAL